MHLKKHLFCARWTFQRFTQLNFDYAVLTLCINSSTESLPRLLLCLLLYVRNKLSGHEKTEGRNTQHWLCNHRWWSVSQIWKIPDGAEVTTTQIPVLGKIMFRKSEKLLIRSFQKMLRYLSKLDKYEKGKRSLWKDWKIRKR